MYPGKSVGLAALLLLVNFAAADGGVACGTFSELSCSEVATSEVDTLWTGAWPDVLGRGTRLHSGWSSRSEPLPMHPCLYLSNG